jgi:hypothetical protein
MLTKHQKAIFSLMEDIMASSKPAKKSSKKKRKDNGRSKEKNSKRI